MRQSAMQLLVCGALVTALIAPAAAQESLVSIDGGVQPDASYLWRVTNNHRSPIVSIEFPHYHADMFSAPPGWQTQSTYLVNVGVEDRPGVCKAFVEDPARGIRWTDRAEFHMRIATSGARVGTGDVRVRFADGKEAIVPGVMVPVTTAPIETYGGMVGVAVVFVIIVAAQMRRRRKRAAANGAAAGAAE